MKTVHMIGNAHLDPVWLWNKIEGIDAVLATARSACDRLDEYPDFIFTSSTSWFHQQIERIDPDLFARIKDFVNADRWQLVAPSVVEPDCNLPSEYSFKKQFELGQKYFMEKFGRYSTIGYNIDSFGHCAYLPRFMRQAGIDSYVFMRPMKTEKNLPADLFRWQSPDGQEITTFRISDSYLTLEEPSDITEHIQRSLENLPEGIDHTMCFFGVGDHGGGPTKAQIQWILDNKNIIEDSQLIISHPRAFFDAVADDIDKLPVIKGELQYHSIGCYSVERQIKTATRLAESKAIQAENIADIFPDYCPEDINIQLSNIWQDILFNQFHDIAGGTCLAPDNLLAASQLNSAAAAAETLTTTITRKAFRTQTEPGIHKIVVLNPADKDFEGTVEHEPWIQFRGTSTLELFDEQDNPIQFQKITPGGFIDGLVRLLFKVKVNAKSHITLKLIETRNPDNNTEKPDTRKQQASKLENNLISLSLESRSLAINNWQLNFDIIDNPTDTWTHNIDRFGDKKLGSFDFDPGEILESGPIRNSLLFSSQFDNSRIFCKTSLLKNQRTLSMKISVYWAQIRQLLRLSIKSPAKITTRTDAVSGGPLSRPIDNKEYPIAAGLIAGDCQNKVAVISKDIFSCSVDENRIALTLIRSPYTAHHDPTDPTLRPHQPVCDQGRTDFDITLKFDIDTDDIDQLIAEQTNLPILWDLTG